MRARTLLDSGAFGDALALLVNEQREHPSIESAQLVERAREGVRVQVRQALEQAAASENAGEFAEAFQQYRSARRLDPATPAIEQSIARVSTRMKADAADAMVRARQYDALDRVPEAISWYERASRNMLDDDPNRRIAKEIGRAHV